MKKISILFLILAFSIGTTYAQNCPANHGMSTLKMVKLNTTDIDIICNETPNEGKVVKEAIKSSANKGSGSGYQWEKKNGNLVVMWDRAKFSDTKFSKLFKKLFRK